MRAIVFPGQGSQARGMGGSLFGKYPELTARASEILGYSISSLCLEGSDEQLKNTRFAQPALYVVGALSYLHEVEQRGEVPSMLAGHSLGEFSALFAAGAFDFETGLGIVKKRAELMDEARGGGMAAVVGLSNGEVRDVLAKHRLSTLYVANINSPKQIVISGPRDDILAAEQYFTGLVRAYRVLNVSGAFHSRYMEEARRKFAEHLAGVPLKPLAIPVVSNVTARPYGRDVAALMAQQITSEVRWCESVRYMLSIGIDEFVELGGGKVMTSLIAQIKMDPTPSCLDDGGGRPAPGSAELPPRAAQVVRATGQVRATSLGSTVFRERYNLKYAYMAGSMYRGISSPELVVRMGRAGLLGFLGTGGLPGSTVERQIREIKSQLGDRTFGVNFLAKPGRADLEEQLVDLIIREGVPVVEASSFIEPSPALVRLRLEGIRRDGSGRVVTSTKIIVKLSRPEVAEVFMRPPPESIVKRLVLSGHVSPRAAELGREIPIADDVCVEADSAGHTDQGVTATLLPAIIGLRDETQRTFGYKSAICVGSAGGIGTPASAASAFTLGADFIVTGSINQCTVESGASDLMKDLLQDMAVQDTAYAPAGDLFEMGARIQVLKRGLFFPARANRLYELYRNLSSIDELDQAMRRQIETKYFNKTIEEVWRETEEYHGKNDPRELERARESGKHRMALIFKWYFAYTMKLALAGDDANRVNFQIHCGPALGAFNQWVKGTELAGWRHRHVDEIAERLMVATAEFLSKRFAELCAA